MTKFIHLAVIAISAATIIGQAHAQAPGPENGRAAAQEPGVAAFYQSLGVGRGGYRAPAEAFAAVRAPASQSTPKGEYRHKQTKGPR
jgi:hypothetical protein